MESYDWTLLKIISQQETQFVLSLDGMQLLLILPAGKEQPASCPVGIVVELVYQGIMFLAGWDVTSH